MKAEKWVMIMSLLTSAATILGQTNSGTRSNSSFPVLTLTNVLKLTPEMERLNRSQFFKTTINDFERTMWSHLQGNLVGDESDDPFVFLGASRRVKFEESLFQPPLIDYWVTVFMSGPKRKYAEVEKQPLVLMLDGTKCTLQQDDAFYDIKSEGNDVSERAWFRVPPELFRSVASARRAQMRLEGKFETVTRSLDSTNIGRFKVFVSAFIDQEKGGHRSGMATAVGKAPGPARCEILETTYRVHPIRGVFSAASTLWDVQWKVKVRNNRSTTAYEKVKVTFLDLSGYEVMSDAAGITLAPNETRTIDGVIPATRDEKVKMIFKVKADTVWEQSVR